MDHLLTMAEKVVATVLAYYRQADRLEPTTSEVLAWLKTCTPEAQAELLLLQPDALLLVPAFRRYLLEAHGHLMATYMAAHLRPAELPFWVEDDSGGIA